MVFTGQRKSC